MKKTLEWEAPEYLYREKSTDWYIALWFVVIAGAIASVLTKNPIFAVFLFIAGVTFTALGTRRPEIVSHEVTEKYIRYGRYRVPYSAFDSFLMFEHKNHTFLRLAFFESTRVKTLIIDTAQIDPHELYDLLSERLEEKDIDLPLIEKIVDILGL